MRDSPCFACFPGIELGWANACVCGSNQRIAVTPEKPATIITHFAASSRFGWTEFFSGMRNASVHQQLSAPAKPPRVHFSGPLGPKWVKLASSCKSSDYGKGKVVKFPPLFALRQPRVPSHTHDEVEQRPSCNLIAPIRTQGVSEQNYPMHRSTTGLRFHPPGGPLAPSGLNGRPKRRRNLVRGNTSADTTLQGYGE